MSEILKKVPTDEVVAALYNDLRSRVEAVEPNDAIVAPDYADLTLPILVGTRCTHNRGLYKCNTQINSSEAWTEAHWDEVTVGSELEDKYEKPANGIPASDIASGVIPDVSGKTDQGAVATPYESLTWPVAAGKYCFHNGYVYRAKQDIATSESWTAAHWDQVVLGNEVSRAMNDIQGKYTKPSGGIPSTDMTQAVQDSLSAADSALIGVGKSEERDGIVQNGDTATRNITKDRYVIWKGNLYTASVNIVTGETLSLSNLDPVSDGGFNALRDEIEQKHSIKAYKKYVQQEQSTGSAWIVLDEIVDIENGDEIEILIYQSDKATYGTSWSNTASWNAVTIQNKNNTSISLQDDKYMNSDKPAMKKIKKMDGYVMYQTFSNNALTGFGIDFPANLDSFKRMVVDPVSSQLKAGCTVEITVRKTI